MNTAGALICMHCGRPMLTSIAIGGLLYHPECAQPPALNPRRPLDAFDEAAIRRIVREELRRSDDQEPTAGSST
ncbi:hypothetical protein [Methylibium petroleiphilum]